MRLYTVVGSSSSGIVHGPPPRGGEEEEGREAAATCAYDAPPADRLEKREGESLFMVRHFAIIQGKPRDATLGVREKPPCAFL